jgi:hypothetical protein
VSANSVTLSRATAINPPATFFIFFVACIGHLPTH